MACFLNEKMSNYNDFMLLKLLYMFRGQYY